MDDSMPEILANETALKVMPASDGAEVETVNDFAMHSGENLANHSTALRGRAKYVRQGVPVVPTFRTKQEAYRYGAYLITLADILPDEEGCEAHTFEVVLDAVRNC